MCVCVCVCVSTAVASLSALLACDNPPLSDDVNPDLTTDSWMSAQDPTEAPCGPARTLGQTLRLLLGDVQLLGLKPAAAVDPVLVLWATLVCLLVMGAAAVWLLRERDLELERLWERQARTAAQAAQPAQAAPTAHNAAAGSASASASAPAPAPPST